MKTKAQKKKTLLNAIMVAAIVCIAVGGVLTVGNIKGWFDKEAPDPADGIPAEQGGIVVTEKVGSANIYRGGLAYALKEENRLRSGDVVETLNRSKVTLRCGDAAISLDENSRMSFELSEDGTVTLSLESGGAFAELDNTRTLLVNGDAVTTESAAVLATANYGSALVGVLSGTAEVNGQTLKSGDRASILAEEQGGTTVQPLSLGSLNSFELNCIRDGGDGLCFTADDVTALEQQRESEKQAALEAVFLSEADEARIREQREQQEVSSQGDKTGSAGGGTSTGSGNNADKTDDPDMYLPVCTIEIRCDTILENMDALTAGKSGYVPANGVILAPSKVSFHDGDTAFDVLKKACELAGIQLEYAWTPLYNSYYIEGINNLYEFDCGEQSGWMYKVNGWFPNYGCSSYKLEDGDVMVWCFTCKGLGADVGGTVY